MDLVKLALRTTVSAEKHTKLVQKYDLSKTDINAAVGLLGLRYELPPRTSTPFKVISNHRGSSGEIRSPNTNADDEDIIATGGSLCDSPSSITPKMRRPPACRNLLNDLMLEESMSSLSLENSS